MEMWNANAKGMVMNAKAITLKINCWCEACDTAKNNGLRTRMSICPDCGDKRCPKALYHNKTCNLTKVRRR